MRKWTGIREMRPYQWAPQSQQRTRARDRQAVRQRQELQGKRASEPEASQEPPVVVATIIANALIVGCPYCRGEHAFPRNEAPGFKVARCEIFARRRGFRLRLP
jgi:hypothetical protein